MERKNKVERHTFVSYFIHMIWWTVRYLVVLKVMHMYVLMLNMLSSIKIALTCPQILCFHQIMSIS